jgi:hypothetical protein
VCVGAGGSRPSEHGEVKLSDYLERHSDLPTNNSALGNLVPLCGFHHLTAIHRWGWTLTLHPDGTTTATSPDGTRALHSHSPPGHTSPGHTRPATTRPATTRPATTRPATTRPATTRPGRPPDAGHRAAQDCQGMTAASPASTWRRAACSSLITCMTALMRARWVNAWGKLPRCRPDRGSISSAYSSSGLA